MYAYCSNNPVMYTDPTGEAILTTIIIAGAIIFGYNTGLIVGGTIGYNAAKSDGLSGGELFWATAKGMFKGGLIGTAAGGLIGLSGGAAITYGVTSWAATTMITGTSTLILKSVEVATLQYKKSLNDGKNGWQAANNSMDSTIFNSIGVVSSMYMKVGWSTASYASALHANAHYVTGSTFSSSWERFISHKSPVSAIFSYVSIIPTIKSTIHSFTCNDPIAIANERGYYLK